MVWQYMHLYRTSESLLSRHKPHICGESSNFLYFFFESSASSSFSTFVISFRFPLLLNRNSAGGAMFKSIIKGRIPSLLSSLGVGGGATPAVVVVLIVVDGITATSSTFPAAHNLFP